MKGGVYTFGISTDRVINMMEKTLLENDVDIKKHAFVDKMEKLEKPFIPRKPRFLFEYAGESSDKLITFKECFIGRQEALFFIGEAILYKKQRVGIV